VRHLALLIALATLFMPFASAADADAGAQQLQKELYEHFAKKDYAAAANSCRKLLELNPKSADANYNLACALARSGDSDGALTSLDKSVEFGFSDVAHMNEDDDLASIRADARFAATIEKARAAEKNGSYEKSAEIAGTKIVENYPDGGLRYRLRMSPNETAQPLRLIVWLHPSGGSMNNVVENLSPLLIQHGYALLVVTKKQWMGWTGPEGEQLLNKTLPDVAKIKGINAEKPILMGFSAGGQAALMMWQDNPSKFGGLILDAAYPLDMAQYAQGKRAVMPLPKDESIKKMPILALVGEKDQGSQLWQKIEPDWHAAGIPLTLRIVPNGVHQWLFGKAQVEELATWLDQVAEGKLPADVK
jgi:predicted esterase